MLVSMLFISCRKENDENIIGNWIGVNGDEWLYLNLNSNGEFEFSVCSSREQGNDCLEQGKYSFKNNLLTLYDGFTDVIYSVSFELENRIQIIKHGGYGDIIDFKRKEYQNRVLINPFPSDW